MSTTAAPRGERTDQKVMPGWASRALEAVDKERFRETVAVVLTVATIILGVTLIAGADRFNGHTFTQALDVAPAPTWGVAFIACALTLMVTIVSSRKDAYWPALFLTALYCLWSNRVAASALHPSSIPSSTVMFVFASVLALLVALSYWREARGRRT